jgi:hypothetical protein
MVLFIRYNGGMFMEEKIENLIKQEIRKYFGNRYYDEYSNNVVTGKEFEKLYALILRCIDINENKQEKYNGGLL